MVGEGAVVVMVVEMCSCLVRDGCVVVGILGRFAKERVVRGVCLMCRKLVSAWVVVYLEYGDLNDGPIGKDTNPERDRESLCMHNEVGGARGNDIRGQEIKVTTRGQSDDEVRDARRALGQQSLDPPPPSHNTFRFPKDGLTQSPQ